MKHPVTETCRFGALLLAVHGLTCASLPLSADEAADSAAAKITYDDHVRPILREHCFTCHSQSGAKGGLALDSYAKLIEGGSSGEVVMDQDLDSSRLWALITHEEEPYMPPGQDKLPDEKLAVIRQWIEGGLLENSGATATAKPRKTLNVASTTPTGKPDGPAAMPQGTPREPVIHTARAGAIAALAASPWAPLVAVAGQEQVLLYHSDSGELLGVLPFPEGMPYSLRFSRDGSKLLVGGGRGGASGCAVLFDVQTGEPLVKVGDELDVVLSCDINNDLTRIALGGPRKIVRVYSTETGELLSEITKHTDWIYAVRFSPDGVLLATADRSNGLFVWESETAREYLNLQGHAGAITDVDWRSDSNVLASASLDGTIRLWEMNNGGQIARANAHGEGVNAVGFTHNGQLVTAGQDRTAKSWNVDLTPGLTFPAFTEPALRVTFTHDGQRVVAGDWSGEVRMWESADGKEVTHLDPNPPTLALRIARHEQEVLAAREAVTQSAAELTAFAAQVKGRVAEQTTAIADVETKLADASESLAQVKNQLEAQVATVATVQTAAQEAEHLVDEAKKALEAAMAKSGQLQETLAAARAQEQSIRQQVPEKQAAFEQLQSTVAARQQRAAEEREQLAQQLAPKQAAADVAQQRLTQLQAALDQLRAEQAALLQAAPDAQENATAPASQPQAAGSEPGQ